MMDEHEDLPSLEDFNESTDTVGQAIAAFFWIHISMSIILFISCIFVGCLEDMAMGGTAKMAVEMSGPGIVVSTIFSVIAIIIARKAPLMFQNVAAGGCMLLFLLYGLLAYQYNYVISIGMVVFTFLLGWMHWRGRHSHYFSSQLLRAVSICADMNPGLYYVPMAGAFIIYFYVQFAMFAWKGLLIVLPTYLDAYRYYVAVYLFFTMFWTCQAILNTLRSIIAQIYAEFFSTVGDPQEQLMRKTIWRTLSLGLDNICVGSLAVSLISAIYSALRYSLGLVVMGWASTQPRSFNYFAFNHVTDGRTFPQASREAWDRMKSTGVMNVYAGSNVALSMFQATVMIAFMSAFFTILFRMIIFGADTLENLRQFFVFCVFGSIVPTLFFKILDDGNLSLLVTLAEEPEKVKQRAPRLVEALKQRFPHLLEAPSKDPEVV